ncbi:MAG: hypothetical protein AB1540_07075 [Bdellovibrionota bacterium]
MLNVVKDLRDDTLLVKLTGSIEENVDFAALIGPPTVPKMDLILKEVPRINSVGVKAWIKYFSGLAAKGIQLRFLECSTAIVEQINLISNFVCNGTVESIYVPFCCQSCSTELLGLFRTSDLKKINFQIPDLKCSKCGSTASFDDIPEEYFGFLTR